MHTSPSQSVDRGLDWHAPGVAANAEMLRFTLDREIRTLRGFCRRVRTDREWSALGLNVGTVILVIMLVSTVFTGVTTPGIDFTTIWARFASTSGAWWMASAFVLIGIGLVASAVRILREFTLFKKDGWTAFQAPTGLVEVRADGAPPIAYDHRMVGGNADWSPDRFGKIVVLVSGAQMSTASFVAALDAVRTSNTWRYRGEESLKIIRQQIAILRAIPSGRWYKNSDGCFIGLTRGGSFVAAIPRTRRGGQRIRLARIRLTSAEKARLGGKTTSS